MKAVKIGLLLGVSILLAGCYQHRFNYQQGPQEFSVLSSADTPKASIVAARDKAKMVCAFNNASAKELHISTAPTTEDKVKVKDNYLYVIQEKPAKRFFTVLNYECVPYPPKQYYPRFRSWVRSESA